MSEAHGKIPPVPTALAEYDVGRGKPPVGTRFAKGVSGNPRGKPKGARNKIPPMNEERLKTIVLEEAYRDIKVNDGDRQITLSMAQAVMRSIAVAAAKGQPRAQTLFTTILATVERERRELHERWVEGMIDYKQQWEKELERRKRLGLNLPDPILHPDHVIVDLVAGTAYVKAPMTKEEKALLDECQALADEEGLEVIDFLIKMRTEVRLDERSPETQRSELVEPP